MHKKQTGNCNKFRDVASNYRLILNNYSFIYMYPQTKTKHINQLFSVTF